MKLRVENFDFLRSLLALIVLLIAATTVLVFTYPNSYELGGEFVIDNEDTIIPLKSPLVISVLSKGKPTLGTLEFSLTADNRYAAEGNIQTREDVGCLDSEYCKLSVRVIEGKVLIFLNAEDVLIHGLLYTLMGAVLAWAILMVRWGD